MSNSFDVVVVGGRVAGSTLAARLAKFGMHVLLVERATFPSLPSVSSPIIYASTMQLLDEIGADEGAYAHNTPQITHMNTVNSLLTGKIRIPLYAGRDYAYAIDRARFDSALWDTACQYPNVTGLIETAVTDIAQDTTERVTGVTLKHKDGTSETVQAGGVVGADGRFSVVARKVNAATHDENTAHPTANYYAYWRNVAPFEAGSGATAVAYEGDGTLGYLVMDSADGQTVVCVEGRSEVLDPPAGHVESFYLAMLQRNPRVWARVENAQRVTSVRGMRNIGNNYRDAGGAGWALVGDAYHQKDPLDGQGIYDAVYTSKVLALSLKRWFTGELGWEEAVRVYDEVARVRTYPMYKTLQDRVFGSFYGGMNTHAIPAWATEAMGTAGAWALADEDVNALMGKMLTRQLPPDMVTVLAAPTLLRALARGGLKALRQRVMG